MTCFQHPEHAAVGICKQCGKGVCRACAIETDWALACSPACAEEIAKLHSMAAHVPQARTGSMVIYTGMGLMLLIIGALLHDTAGSIIALMGVLMLIGAYLSRPRERRSRDRTGPPGAGL